MSIINREILYDKADHTFRPIIGSDGTPFYPFPNYTQFDGAYKARVCDSGGDFNMEFRECIAVRLGEVPDYDGKNQTFLGDNVIDLFIDGMSGSEYDNNKNSYHVSGYKYLCSADREYSGGRGEMPNHNKYTNSPDKAPSLWYSESSTQSSAGARTGFYLGSRYANMEFSMGRWICPIGCTFKWSNNESDGPGPNPQGRLDKCFFLFQEKDRYKLQFAPLVWNYQPQDDQGLNTFEVLSGAQQIHEYRSGKEVGEGEDGSKVKFNYSGEQKYFLPKKDIEYLKTHHCALVGMLWTFRTGDSAGNLYYHVTNIWNFKFLFDTVEHPKSAVVFPAEMSMYDYLECGNFRIA